LTPAERTPGTLDRAFSTRATQLAQVMPTMGSANGDPGATAVFMRRR
jgi:hypothetical protein